MMKNYIEKYLPSGEFDKSKVRVLVRGDLQHLTGETEGPVTRVESIFILTSNAAYRDLEIFKIDVTSAYLNTPMNDDVKHKWLMFRQGRRGYSNIDGQELLEDLFTQGREDSGRIGQDYVRL